MLKLLIYAYAVGLFSSRKIAKALEELVQKDPGNRYALMVLAQKLQERGLALAHGREARTGASRRCPPVLPKIAVC